MQKIKKKYTQRHSKSLLCCDFISFARENLYIKAAASIELSGTILCYLNINGLEFFAYYYSNAENVASWTYQKALS